MMIDFSKYTDPYERKARLYPSLICLSPIIVATSISFPVIFSNLSGLIALAAAVGLIQFLSHLSRDRGKALERQLFEMWGGMPSATILRHRDELIPSPAKLRYHSVLSKETEIQAPTKESEVDQPQQADEVYLSWSDFLRGKTRDSERYSMVFKENINYGFRRNLLGIRSHCIFTGIIGLVIILAPIQFEGVLNSTSIAVALILLAYLYVLVFVVKSSWVKVVAQAYAKQLIEALNQ